MKQWYPNHPPIYDIKKTYLENVQEGPFFDDEIPFRQLPPRDTWIDFLGFDIATPLSVPAGPLLTAKWTTLAAKLGFDIPVYKTIRSKPHPAHPLPNMIYVDTHKAPPAIQVTNPSPSISELAVTNSFGMPSMSEAFLEEDISEANDGIGPGQVLVVSVVASPRPGEDFFQDFVDTALFAKRAGAKIIEANFSCPNVSSKDGILYTSPDTVYELGKKMVKALGNTPLIIKVGTFESIELMREVFCSAAKAGIRAISGINTISMPVVNATGAPALGEKRKTSGICGGPIRNAALKFAKDGATINKQEKLDLTLMAGGGITESQHFDLFFEQGIDVSQTATGMMWDPYLAMRYHQRKGYVEAAHCR